MRVGNSGVRREERDWWTCLLQSPPVQIVYLDDKLGQLCDRPANRRCSEFCSELTFQAKFQDVSSETSE